MNARSKQTADAERTGPQDERGAGRPTWLPSPRVLVILAILVVGYLLLKPLYYSWVLGPPITVVVYCDVEPLRNGPLTASVLYDQLALSPPAQLLGLYRNRPPAAVRSFYGRNVARVALRDYGVVLHGVPDGPIRQVNIHSDGQWFHAPVQTTNRRGDTLYVFL